MRGANIAQVCGSGQIDGHWYAWKGDDYEKAITDLLYQKVMQRNKTKEGGCVIGYSKEKEVLRN